MTKTLKISIIAMVVVVAIGMIIYAVGITANQSSGLPPCIPGQPCAVEEEQGILLIKETQEYKTLIEQYGQDIVSVKAVNLLDVGDTLFLQNIDKGFEQNPGCIIVLEYKNNEGYVYQLDEDLNIIYQMNFAEFVESANRFDPDVLEDFIKSLK